MPQVQIAVTHRQSAKEELSERWVKGAVLLRSLAQAKVLEEVAQRLRVPRQGGYSDVDFFIFFVLYLSDSPASSIREFRAAAQAQEQQLAALGGRRHLPSASAVSRYLATATMEQVDALMSWLLRQGSARAEMLQHPAAGHRDTEGVRWHYFDWDPTVTTVRHRAVPEGPELPPARRRAARLATPGYGGRKRGELRFSRVSLQHAGTGHWVYSTLVTERGDTAAQLPPALAAVDELCQAAHLDRSHAVIRSDGGNGTVGWITEVRRGGYCPMTRVACYEILDQLQVREHLNEATWEVVPDSGSGPQRLATDLGVLTLRPGKESTAADGRPLEPIQIRAVVSRFASTEKAGAGYVIDGWQYELVVTDLPASGWPAAETVAAYYGRSGQENRFGQEDHEFALDRIFSYELPGQALVVGIGQFLWNWLTALGYAQNPPPATEPEALRRRATTVAAPPLPLPSAETASGDDGAALPTPSPATSGPTAPDPAFLTTLEQVDWASCLARLPAGWQHSANGLGLTCPQGTELSVSAVRPSHHHQQGSLRLLAPARACKQCPRRADCGARTPRFVKEVNQGIPDELVAALKPQVERERRRRWQQPSAPPTPLPTRRTPLAPRPCSLVHGATAGSWAVVGPLLLVAMLRHALALACRSARVWVRVTQPPSSPLRHPALALDEAQRQRRRQTWSQRHAYNALPAAAMVGIRVNLPRASEWVLGERHGVSEQGGKESTELMIV